MTYFPDRLHQGRNHACTRLQSEKSTKSPWWPSMLFIVIRHPIRPQYAEEFPRLVEGFTAASCAEPGTIGFE